MAPKCFLGIVKKVSHGASLSTCSKILKDRNFSYILEFTSGGPSVTSWQTGIRFSIYSHHVEFLPNRKSRKWGRYKRKTHAGRTIGPPLNLEQTTHQQLPTPDINPFRTEREREKGVKDILVGQWLSLWLQRSEWRQSVGGRSGVDLYTRRLLNAVTTPLSLFFSFQNIKTIVKMFLWYRFCDNEQNLSIETCGFHDFTRLVTRG